MEYVEFLFVVLRGYTRLVPGWMTLLMTWRNKMTSHVYEWRHAVELQEKCEIYVFYNILTF